MSRWFFTLGLACVLTGGSSAADPVKPSPEQSDFFEKKVRPVLAEHCYSCHGPKKQSAGLRLDTAVGMKQGADDGPVMTPGEPTKSRLITAVNRKGEHPMPPKSALPPDAIAALTEWVKIGAPYPVDLAKPPTTDPRTHWAFQPVRKPPVPVNRDPKASTHPIDAFVQAKLRDNGLSLAPRADRRTLIRRAYFDLLGLPPTAAEVEAFEKDNSPNAWEKVIDRLLASPQYGERWGRYWLDVARYADSKGYVFNEERAFPYAYTYRDYVIRSFNEDKPFDRFVIEQLAADRLNLGADKRPLAAMGYLTLGRRFLNNTHDIIDDRIDVVTRGMMGLTVTCARCHDHKYDPIPAADYYSLYGVFASSVEPKELPLIEEAKRTPEVAAFEADLKKREEGLRETVAKRSAAQVAKLRTADGVSDYVRAAFDSRNKPARELQGFARERDVNRFALERWRAYLDVQLKKGSPVFTPLAALHTLPPTEFAAKAPGILTALARDPKKPANPLVLKALADAKPKTFRQAAEAVAEMIASRWPQPGPIRPAEAELVAVLGPGGPADVSLADAEKLFNRADRDAIAALRKKIEAFKATNRFAPARAHVLNDGGVVQPVVFLRGNPNTRGPAVPRQAPAVVAGPGRKPFTDGSGRLELARAIASPDNPLTARVFVNRVWIGHFGRGLVRTPSDFGLRSDPPTHPELLDWLAAEFVSPASGPHQGAVGAEQSADVGRSPRAWSVKRLHRLIMTSATYQQASSAERGTRNAGPRVVLFGVAIPGSEFRAPRLEDPENRLLSHQNRRRLDFEAMRDSLLAAAGRLDLTAGGKAVNLFKAPFTTRRTVYGFVDRSNLPGAFRAFDFANPDTHSPQRFQTTVPQQALFLMNSPFVAEQARAVVSRTEMISAKSIEQKIRALYRAVYSRNPTAEELALGMEFIGDASSGGTGFGKWEQYAQVLLLSNEFAFVD